MNGKTLSLVIVSLIGGILIGRLPLCNEWDALFPVSAALGGFCVNLFLSKQNPFNNFNWINDIVAVFLFLGIGLFSSVLHRPATTKFIRGDYAFSGTVRDYTPTSYGDKLLINLSELYLKNKDRKLVPINVTNVNALVTLQDATNIKYGSIVKGYATLQPIDYPSNFKNEDYLSYLRSKGIYLTGFTESDKCNFTNNSNSLFSFFLSLRDEIEAHIESTFLNGDTKSFLISVLLGDKTYINKEDRITFSDAGVAHIFAVSGLHVSLISFALLSVVSLFLFGHLRKWKFLICIPIIWFYILLVGFSPATCRAGIMLTISFMAFFLERKQNALKALGWSIVLILSFLPSALFDIGFQLSVVCVGSLILIASPLNFVDRRSHPKLHWLTSLLLVSLITTLSSWIICAFYFHRFSLMFLPLNLIAVPLLPLFLTIAVIYITLFGMGINISFAATILDQGYQLFQKGALWLNTGTRPIENIHPHIISVLCWIAAILLLAYFLNRKKKNIKLLVPSISCFTLSILALIFIPVSLPSGFIVQKNNYGPCIISYDKGKETQIVLPDEGSSAKAVVNNKKFIAVRSEIMTDSTKMSLNDADYILICKGCKTLPENFDSYVSANSKIITHPSLHWRYEKAIINEAREKKLALHSLRYDGPLHFFED